MNKRTDYTPTSALAEKKILLIISGGIAAYKSLELIRLLKKSRAHVTTILTKGGSQFVTPLSISALSETKTYSDLWNLNDEQEMGHIRLSRENDLIVIAPASADLMAKMAHGLANDLASTTLLASNKQILICPAMNPLMWSNAATQENVRILKSRGVLFSDPEHGEMACGETGAGRMREAQVIHDDIAHFFDSNPTSHSHNTATTCQVTQSAAAPLPLQGKTALVTAGPTHEPLDPVRFIGNHSSGKQGYAIAVALKNAGAKVTLISGPTSLPAPYGIEMANVTTAQQMHDAVHAHLPVDIAICCAAVADWRSAKPQTQKMKKSKESDELTLTLVKNPDILRSLGTLDKANRPSLVIGFAAETEDLIENAEHKRTRKNADMIIANNVATNLDDNNGHQTNVFGADTNQVTLISQNKPQAWAADSKENIARKLVTCIIESL